MTVVKDLFALQQMDLAVDRRTKRLALVKAALKEDAALIAARKELAASEAKAKETRVNQKLLEIEVETAKSRFASIETRMMSNEGVTARELPALQRELAHVQEQQGTLDDQGLRLMETLQEVQAQVKTQSATVQEMEGVWRESQKELLAEQAAVNAELSPARAERQAQAGVVDAAMMQAYERLRVKKAGVAVARVEKGICTGCRISLPTTLIQRARVGRVLATCPTCGRIVFAE